MDNQLEMIAGGLGRELAMNLAQGEAQAISAEDKSAFALDIAFPEQSRKSLLEELRLAHCDLLPLEALQPMVTVQRVRDGVMARALLSAGKDGAVLIAGKGHTRNDRAIPYVLKQLDSAPDGDSIVSIGMEGVRPYKNSFSDYLDDKTSMPFDFVVFTDRAEPVDYCKELRKRFSTKSAAE